MSEPQTVKVNIRGLAVGGSGVGEVLEQSDGGEELLGITAFVPYAAAGEVVEARITQKKERYLKTELLSVQSHSPSRIEPRCEFYQSCGGCELQHITYEAELDAKQAMIEGGLKAARLSQEVINSLQPIVPGEEFAYRRRINLHIDAAGRIGFYRSSSRSLVEIDKCEIANEEINSSLDSIKGLAKKIADKISSINLEADFKGVVAVLKSTRDLSRTELNDILEASKKHLENVCVMHGNKELGGFGRQILELSLAPSVAITLKIPAGGFSQVNDLVNGKMVEYVSSFVSGGQRVLDLYSGAGNFSVPMARKGASVESVECDERLCMFQKQNAESYNLSNKVKVHCSSTEKFLSQEFLKGAAKDFEVIVADPPRNGLGGLVKKFNFGSKLILVSCDLASFSRDVRALLDLGWQAEEITPFDMFSQTSHVEIVGVFEKKV